MLCFTSIVIAVFSTLISFGRTSARNVLVSPIRNFEPSWTASSSGGTTIAIPCSMKGRVDMVNEIGGEPAVVMIFRSFSMSSLANNNDATIKASNPSAITVLSGLRVVRPIYISADDVSSNCPSQRWTHMGSTAVCSMNGFVPDVDFLTRFLQQLVEDYRTTNENNSLVNTVPMSTIKLVQYLADELQNACQWQGGRPFGVQAILVGKDTFGGISTSLSIYTVDPSGGYRRWIGGTAVGWHGNLIRKKMLDYRHSPNKKYNILDALSALTIGLQASIFSQNNESERESDQYEALLVWQANGNLCVAMIDPSQIEETKKSILSQPSSE
jgi:20S proteasome alpha/beta subunit